MNLASPDISSFLSRFEELKLLECIGSGAYGEVHRATFRDQVVAVKLLKLPLTQQQGTPAEVVDRFCAEAAVMCQLSHPNIVSLHGVIAEPDNLCLILEFCAGGTLKDLLGSDRDSPILQRVQFAIDTAQGMVYLHGSRPMILHRDLKPDNLLITQDGTVKVADFGVTRFLGSRMSHVGTPGYMAPEVILEKGYSQKTDIYAFGIILFEILCRTPAYQGLEPIRIVFEVANHNLRPHIQTEFENSPLVPLMRACWDPVPNKRPDFVHILAQLRSIRRRLEQDLGHAGTGGWSGIEKIAAEQKL